MCKIASCECESSSQAQQVANWIAGECVPFGEAAELMCKVPLDFDMLTLPVLSFSLSETVRCGSLAVRWRPLTQSQGAQLHLPLRSMVSSAEARDDGINVLFCIANLDYHRNDHRIRM